MRGEVSSDTCPQCQTSQSRVRITELLELTYKLCLLHLLELVMEKLDIIEEPQVRHVQSNELVQRRKVPMIEGSDVVKIRLIFLI